MQKKKQAKKKSSPNSEKIKPVVLELCESEGIRQASRQLDS